MDCLKCAEMKEVYFPFHDGHFTVQHYCKYYSAPCDRALKDCELKKLDEKIGRDRKRTN